ncbi:hypothetical protein DENIS_3240 [Desulfonema ishimotonii]|uniref:Uncharacterized protein n=1 Tax=Desulfonema ishimotonii TaxID=45657 RepID=A0A401FZ66_9BACT|nr:hypothetical protein [Desulfonema ishimotonii]GBC62271.1 hypothetical protein DENIS_3240 [Desulfonema ishimotonii]
MKRISGLIISILLTFSAQVFAWDDGVTHPLITEIAIDNSGLDSYLKDVLNFDFGTETEIEGVDAENKVFLILPK